jgi:hypothetical protein
MLLFLPYNLHISLNAILILLTSVFQILEFRHSNEINNKWKLGYYCILYVIYNTVMQLENYVLCGFQV